MDLLSIPMVFSGDREFVHQLNDPIINAFISQIPEGPFLFDSRSHILQRNMYGCIPGWHLDHIYRDENGLLDFSHPGNYQLEHYIMFLGIAPTQILLTHINPCKYPSWKQANSAINSRLADGELEVLTTEPGKVYRLAWDSFHRGTAAETPGTRCFMRASFGLKSDRVKNEIRKQVQTYVSLDYGW